MTAALRKLMVDAATASGELRAVRASARAVAISAVRQMEQSLVDALEGETLKGLRDLFPRYAGACVRLSSAKPHKLEEPIPQPRPFELCGRWVLVVASDGVLEMVRSVRVGTGTDYETRAAVDDDLCAEDVEYLGKLIPELLATHVERATRSAAGFGRLERIARRISAALVAV